MKILKPSVGKWLFLATLSIVVFTGLSLLVQTRKAYAISNNWAWIPGFIRTPMEQNSTSTCDRPTPPTPADPDPQFNYAQYRWISQAGMHNTSSTTPSIDHNYGDPDVDLAVNYLSVICNSNINGPYNGTWPYFYGGIQVKDKKVTRFTNVAGTASTSYGTLTGIDGEATDVLYADGFANNWRYMTNLDGKPFHNDFTLGGLAGLSVGLHTITVSVEVRAIHKWSDDRFVCIDYEDPADSGDAASLNDPKCLKRPTTMTVILNVLPPIDKTPTGVPVTTCSGINLSNVEDGDSTARGLPFDVYYSPPGAFIKTGTADGVSNTAIIDLRNVVAPGTTVAIGIYNYNYLDINDNSNAHWITHTWSPDPNCPPPYNITAIPQPGLTPDSESPDTWTPNVEFSANFPWGTKYKLTNIDLKCKFYVLKADGTKPVETDKDTVGAVFDAPTHKQSCTDTITPLAPYGLKAGDQVCVQYSATPGSGNIELPLGAMITPGAALSDTKCWPITNKPFVSFLGSDVKAGGDFGTGGACTNSPASSIKAFTRKNLGMEGSAVEFAAFALGTIDANDFVVPNSNLRLQIFGYFAGCIKDHFADADGPAPSLTTPGNLTVGDVHDGKHTYVGNLTINGVSSVGVGKHIYLYVEGDVTIAAPITMDQGPWTDQIDIPSFYLVVKGSIKINGNVGRLDGVYVSQGGGSIDTCANSSLAAMYVDCGNQLVVNGAFIAKKVHLNRTLGSLRDEDPANTNPICSGNSGVTLPVCAAEIFNFNPAIYIASSPAPKVVPGNPNQPKKRFINTLPPLL